MIQTILMLVVFAGAVAYLGRMVYRSFRAKTSSAGCASGCGKCGAVDFNKIEQQLRQKGI
ncbi:FeoB-associated Cys-rich membrane protein [Dawidia cretensis]|uniref:FeoB-associated Cys-rich membrane protein n=1 Tax=Dawidia cretensis TaxID=2782350 RepID=UPI0020B1A3AA|nr:FeoB-associated Cys-rich membrane protein [Dawidia cretensis]